jgi:hypothetical protein
LSPEFFAGGLPKKKVYLGGMSILSILLSIELGCHNPPPQKTDILVGQPQVRNIPLDHVCTSSTDIHVPYVQLAAYVPYRVPP